MNIFFPVIFFCIAFFCTPIFSAGLILYEIGSPISGTAAVGQSIVDHDASVSFFNPAAMHFVKGNAWLVGGQLTKSNLNFSTNSSNTISGTVGGNAGMLAPGMGVFALYHPEKYKKITYGINITGPVAAAASYTDGWVGRYFINKASLLVLAVNPSISYAITSHFSIGAGVALNYGVFSQSIAINRPLSPSDGEIEFDTLDDFAGQFNIGVAYAISETTKMGISYRSPINLKLSGTTRFTRLVSSPPVKTDFTIPQTVLFSLSQALGKKVVLLGDIGWQNWGVFQSSILQLYGLPSVTIPRNWKDTWRLGIGSEYSPNDTLRLKAGISYDSSPANYQTRRPELPIDKQWRYALGLDYTIMPSVQFNASFQYANFGKAPIFQNNTLNGTLSGQYRRNNIYLLQASLSVRN